MNTTDLIDVEEAVNTEETMLLAKVALSLCWVTGNVVTAVEAKLKEKNRER